MDKTIRSANTFDDSNQVESPWMEYHRLLELVEERHYIGLDQRTWLYETYELFQKKEGLSTDQMNRVRGLLLNALYMDYRYPEAEEVANLLSEQKELPVQAYYSLIDFFSKTRRYEKADDVIETVRRMYGSGSDTDDKFKELTEKNETYRRAKKTGKKEYMPRPRENKETVAKAYMDFLVSLEMERKTTPEAEPNIAPEMERNIPPKKTVTKTNGIKQRIRELRRTDFNTFVAYDFETTGFSATKDNIIEIGAIRVVDGQIIETEEFTFQKFVKPNRKQISPIITRLTGIRPKDVEKEKYIWEVLPDFLDFAGDSILIGYNNISFDSKFLTAAGKECGIQILNPQFDVMKYAKRRGGQSNSKYSLDAVSRRLGIKNPRAHRALADAITTARVFLTLREMDGPHKR